MLDGVGGANGVRAQPQTSPSLSVSSCDGNVVLDLRTDNGIRASGSVQATSSKGVKGPNTWMEHVPHPSLTPFCPDVAPAPVRVPQPRDIQNSVSSLQLE